MTVIYPKWFSNEHLARKAARQDSRHYAYPLHVIHNRFRESREEACWGVTPDHGEASWITRKATYAYGEEKPLDLHPAE